MDYLCSRPIPVGMSFSVEILAEHPECGAPPEDLVVHHSIYPVNVAIDSSEITSFSVGDELNVYLCICHFE